MQRQLDAFTHTCFQVASYDGYVELSARLNALVAGGPEQDAAPDDRRGGDRERGQDCPRGHQPPRRDRVSRRVPRPHAAGVVADGVEHRLSPELRAVRVRGLPHALPVRVPRRQDRRRRWRRCSTCSTRGSRPAQVAAIIIEPQLGEGGFVPAPVEFMRELRRLVHRARHRAHRRRDPDRLRPHRPDVRLRALRHRARSGDAGQEPRRRAAAVGGGGEGGDHGRAGRGWPGRHLRRQPGGVRRGAGRARRVRRRARARSGDASGARPRARRCRRSRRATRRSATCAASGAMQAIEIVQPGRSGARLRPAPSASSSSRGRAGCCSSSRAPTRT